MTPTIALRDFGLQDVDLPPNGYVVLEAGRSRGRFPTGLSVAQVEPAGFDAAEPSWRVVHVPTERAVYWNSLLPTETAVPEVVVLEPLALVDGQGNLPTIVKTAARAEAGLCVLYGPRATEFDAFGYLAVLLETGNGRVVAAVQSHAGPEDFTPPPSDRFETDMRTCDAEHIALRRLQEQVRRCTLELAANDERAETETSPWQEATTRPAPLFLMPFNFNSMLNNMKPSGF